MYKEQTSISQSKTIIENTSSENNLRVFSLLKGIAGGALSACIAESLTIPMDTVKVRL